MSFFFNETKADSKPKTPKKVRLQDIPVASLRQLGCSVCPRDKDTNLKSPKMKPSGPDDAPVYLLGSAPSEDEDADNNHWTDKAGDAVFKKFGRNFMERSVRSNFIQQCRGDQDARVVECCRGRIVADIERVRPEIVVTIGDAPLQWAVGNEVGNAIPHRGALFVARIGNHVCHVFSILYPNFVFKKKGFGRSEYELVLEHDIQRVKSMVGKLPKPVVYTSGYDDGIEIITGEGAGDFQRLEDALNDLAREKRSAIDIETTGLRPFMLPDPRILTCAVGTFKRTVAFTVDHPTEGWSSDKRRKEVKGLLHDYILESGRKAAHGLGFELEWFAHEFGPGIMRRTEWDDTMAMGHTLDERESTKSLDLQVRRAFGFGLKALANIDTKRLLEYPLAQVLKYNGRDTKWTDHLRDYLEPHVEEENPEEYLRKLRLAPTLVATEHVGLIVDFDYAKKQKARLEDAISDVEKRLKRCPEIKDYEQRKGTFSPTNSDHVLDLYKVVCERDEVRVEDRDGSVHYTTGEDVLAKIPPRECPSAPLILEHRGASKLLSTYVEPVLSRKIVCRDGRVRSKYSSMVAVTGRIQSEDPNVQNFPKRKHKDIRGMISAPEWIVSCDYGQIEFRVVGMASEDDRLCRYAWTGYDVHGDWAQRIINAYGPVKDYIWHEFQDSIRGLLKKDPDEDKAILKTLRQEAKNGWVFPQLFGSSTRSCATNLHIPEEVAERLGEEFWDEFPQVKRWHQWILSNYERNLYVQTLGGRKRRGAMSPNEAINLPIQGTAADIVTEGMNALSERADAEYDDELQPVLNVHDDLTFYISDATIKEKVAVIAREMCKPRFSYINVPLIVEVSVGPNWYEQEEIAKYSSTELFNIPNPYA